MTVLDRVPPEIKIHILEFALPDDVPEVCILWPLVLNSDDDFPSLPLLVDTGFPVIMHVCSEWRDLVMNTRSFGVRLRESSLAGCAVPFRAFRPDLDTLYIGACNHRFLTAHNFILATAENVALELASAFIWDNVANLIYGMTKSLRTLSLVFNDYKETPHELSTFQAPARRCRLENLTSKAEYVSRATDDYGEVVTVDSIMHNHKQ